MDRPIVVKGRGLHGEPTPTPGVTRFEAFADERVWVGRVENAPYQASAWHVHPGHHTYGHAIGGRFFVEFGPDGSERVEMEPGDFVHIPKGVVHREGSAGGEPSHGIIVRVGEGPLTINLDGPEPA